MGCRYSPQRSQSNGKSTGQSEIRPKFEIEFILLKTLQWEDHYFSFSNRFYRMKNNVGPLKPPSHMNCNLSATALRPKISRSAATNATTVQPKPPLFSCRAIGNESLINCGLVRDRLAIGGWELSMKIGDQLATSQGQVGDLLVIDCRLIGDVLRLVSDWLATGCRSVGDLIKDISLTV